MATLDEIKVTFFEECRELLEDMEAGLITMNDGGTDSETVNAVFRAAHSIKGGAGAFGFADLVAFAHKFETALDEVRAERLVPMSDVMAVFLRAADRLADLVGAAETGASLPSDESLLGELAALAGADQSEEDGPSTEEAAFTPMTLDFGDISEDEESGTQIGFLITFTPRADLYRRGNEPALLMHALSHMGELTLSVDPSDLPALDAPIEDHALTWNIELKCDAPEADIREVFEFVEDDCRLSIDPWLEDALPAPAAEVEAEAPPAPFDAAPPEAPPDPDPGAPPNAPPPKPEPTAKPSSRNAGGSIRVDLDRVDRLINLVGELVVNQAMLSQSVIDAGLTTSSPVATGLDEFKNLTREVQDSVMAIRAQPVRSLFQRMSRIVRECAAATDKPVRLITVGEATEIDKTVIDLLADPLTHMIRNAIDHGLEDAEARKEAGKTAEGAVRLSAAHRSGRVIIEIADDGAGINRTRVRAIAEEKGLIAPEAALSASDVDNLLFLPGFSTAKEVSNLSGRGVGMDVVKQAIQKLGGRISITSNPGQGSTFTISLPLTLAVLDGMVVTVDDETLVVPLSAIVETLRPAPAQVHTLGSSQQVIHVRDSFVPIVDLGRSLGYSLPQKPRERDVYLLIDSDQGGQCALGLDVIIEQRQVVIKSLEDNYGHVDGIAAATILGNGRIALILDPDALMPAREQATMGGAA